ncbi:MULTISPECIES: GMC oxidoreductase [Dyella]|uniref:GMC oxidoreductase n=1 Tax=Dyella TaxID=231454 RepID=UPI000C81D6A2|nr:MULTISPECIES: GMC oxidoreductase [Dyella]MDR3445554.1 GMC oxidoreductase [Dyella sp.]PMQ05220.1 Fructose dehydrogenase large subunit [Dyella sp. AD56]ULU24012.1 GMC family oxidoreductase [Dyella terrae]
MIIDYLNGAHPKDVEADLCIVGAGAAGIAIAHSFIGTSVQVCLLESGGLGGEDRSQALCEGSSSGHVEFDPGTSRMRVFGGSCNLWGGGCIPLSSDDLKPRDWVPHSGWPISYAELEPYYARARSFCQLGDITFTEGTFTEPTARTVLPFDDDKLINPLFARCSILFGDAYRDTLDRAPNIKVLLHANLLELMPSADGVHVQEAVIGSLGGQRGHVRARHYVLASGGIENARLLLLSNSVVQEGLGNQRDVVGRYFMDHPSGTLGTLTADESHRVTRPYERLRGKNAPSSFPEIALSPAYQRSQRVLNGRVHPFGVEGPLPRGIRALRELRTAMRKTVQDENALLEARLSEALRNAPPGEVITAPSSLGLTALKLGLGVGDIAKAFVHKLTDRPAVRNSHVELVGYFEQAPNPESRITLSNDTDVLGQRKVCVDWRLTSLDHHTYRRSATLFGNELARSCNGHFALAPWLADAGRAEPDIHGTAHHIGTTRMSDNPGQGVVDRDCKVHGMDNLHVAGSSVFPTGGWAFPTFTIVALSLRLADELRVLLMSGFL